jgi:hypothetical protein
LPVTNIESVLVLPVHNNDTSICPPNIDNGSVMLSPVLDSEPLPGPSNTDDGPFLVVPVLDTNVSVSSSSNQDDEPDIALPVSDSNLSILSHETNIETVSLLPVTDGWGDWNLDDDPLVEPSNAVVDVPPQNYSSSSLSSSISKTGDSTSLMASDDDDTPNQQRTQRKKYRKKQVDVSQHHRDETESRTTPSHSIAPIDETSRPTANMKHDVKNAHHVLDRLSAQSTTQTVRTMNETERKRESYHSTCSQVGRVHGVISARFYRQPSKVSLH